jgi:hypothetical protein
MWNVEARMAKGYMGQTCAEAIREVFKDADPRKFTEILHEVSSMGSWKQDTILQHLMSTVVNLPPARLRWQYRTPFLFLRPDGRYELYDPDVHPRVID